MTLHGQRWKNEQTLSLFGKKVALVQEEKAEDQILDLQEIQRNLEELYTELKKANPKLQREEILILLSVNLMDQLLIQKKEMDVPADRELAVRTSQLISLIDSGIIGNTN